MFAMCDITNKIGNKASEDKCCRIDTYVLQGIPSNFKMNKIKMVHIRDSFSSSNFKNKNLYALTKSNSLKNNNKVFRKEMSIKRTEEQEYAYRQIEDVHNYSKLKPSSSSNIDHCQLPIPSRYSRKNCSQPSGDSRGNDIEPEKKSEKNTAHFPIWTQEINQNKTAAPHASLGVKLDLLACNEIYNEALPDHHIRRPMNAFLIFCKRHRGIVKEKFKSFENRAITKILGEWWAFLDASEKTCYMNLAQQNKDAFFNAHPNFKWYKLPAPCKRSLNTRPRNNDFSDFSMNKNSFAHESARSYFASSNLNWNNVSYFKLADEKHMGELKKLIHSKDLEESKLSEDSPSFRSQINTKSIYINSNCADNPCSCSSSEVYLTPKKSVRSFKGIKYKEILNASQITTLSPKKHNFSSPAESNLYMVKDLHDRKVTTSIINNKNTTSWTLAHRKDLDDFNKPNENSTFNLEEKIGRLPIQSFETYLHRKKNTKYKKKDSCRKRASAMHKAKAQEIFSYPSPTVISKPKTFEPNKQAIGSQKRKARKESIVRRNSTSVHNDIQMLLRISS